MSANEHIEELLSGFLDGELTSEELREFEAAMAADAGLSRKLEQMRQLSNDLRSVPKRKLAADFADRVLAAALQESQANDSLGTQHVVNKRVLNKPITQNGERQGKRWRTAGAVVALAASLLFVLYISNWFSVPGENVAVVPTTDLNPGGFEAQYLHSSPETPALAGTANQDEVFIRNDPNARKNMKDQLGFAVLTVMEIEPSLKAWNENEVGTVLRDAGILWTNPVNASEEVIGVLNETRSINQGLPKSGEEQIALVLVKANALRMDKALLGILNRMNDFPHVFMDIAFDLPGKELCQKLVDAQLAAVDGQQAIATPFVIGTVGNGGMESVSQFSGARPAKYLAPALRHSQPLGNAISNEEEDAISYVLLVIRKPTK